MTMRKLPPLLIPVLLVLWTVGFSASPQVEVKVLSLPKGASSGERVTHVFAIKNLGDPDTFSIDLSLPSGLRAVAPPSSVTLGVNEEQILFITVIVTVCSQTTPWEARPGENYVELTATSQSNPAISDSATAIIIVLPPIPMLEVP